MASYSCGVNLRQKFVTNTEEDILFFKILTISILNTGLSLVDGKVGLLRSGVLLSTIGGWLVEIFSYLALAVPLLLALLRLYREFMLASDEHRRRQQEFGDNYKPKIGDFMRVNSNIVSSSTGGTGGDDKDKKPGSGNGISQ